MEEGEGGREEELCEVFRRKKQKQNCHLRARIRRRALTSAPYQFVLG